MKAYNEALLTNQWVQGVIREWTEKGLLTNEQEAAIRKAYADLPYSPHWFVWIGLFVFSSICILAGSILFIPFVDVAGAEKFFLPLYGIVLYFLLNYLIRDRKLHFSGIDNVLLYSILPCFSLLILELSSVLGDAPWIYTACYLPILLVVTYRYGEPLIALSTFLSGGFILASLAIEVSWGRLLLPFLLMGYAGAVWFWIHRFLKKEESFYWNTALQTVKVAALVLVYLGGNYGVVREGNAALNDLSGASPEIAFAPFFWLLTFGLPFLYFLAALRWKDLTFLVLATLALVASLSTLHHYYPLLPGEWALTLLGATGIGLAIYLMNALKEARKGFIYTAGKTTELHVLAGNIMAMQVAGPLPQQPQGTDSGGGDFGGGGSGDSY